MFVVPSLILFSVSHSQASSASSEAGSGEKDQKDSQDEDEAEPGEEEKLSNKKKKKQNRLTVADLKQFVNRADVVEVSQPLRFSLSLPSHSLLSVSAVKGVARASSFASWRPFPSSWFLFFSRFRR